MFFLIFVILLLTPFMLVMAAGVIEWRHRVKNGIVNPDYYGVEEDNAEEAMRTLRDIALKRERAREIMDSDRTEAERLLAEAEEEEEQIRAEMNPN